MNRKGTQHALSAISDGIAGSRREVVAEAGHASSIEQPVAVSDRVEQFVDSVSLGSTHG